MEEEWVEIEDYPRYAVSNYGEVINLETGRLLKPRSNTLGYQKVALTGDEGVKDHYIHQLVAQAFFGNFRRGMQISHVNGDLTNNHLHNLRLRSGVSERVRTEREPGEGWGKRVRIVETGEVFRTVRACADYIGGDWSSIYACLRGDRKKHLGYSFEYFA